MWDLNFGTWISHRGLYSGLWPRAPTSMYDSDLKSQEQKCQSHTCSARIDMYDSDLKSQESVKLTIDNPQLRSH